MTKIKDLPAVDRPREKLLRYGPDKLKNEELLALVLGSGTKGVNVRTLAGKILRDHKNNLSSITVEELTKIKGLGSAKAAQVIAVLELGKRLFQNKEATLILSPEDVWKKCEDFRGSKKEHFAIFFLDVRNQEIRRETISIGTLNASLVHPREVFEPAIRYSAASIILVHNHPSGDCTPSDEDRKVTDRLVEAGKLLGIEVQDHVIISSKRYKSILHNQI